jgi:hypothetical protein
MELFGILRDRTRFWSGADTYAERQANRDDSTNPVSLCFPVTAKTKRNHQDAKTCTGLDKSDYFYPAIPDAVLQNSARRSLKGISDA